MDMAGSAGFEGSAGKINRYKPVRMPYRNDRINRKRVKLAMDALAARKGRASTRMSTKTQDKMKV